VRIVHISDAYLPKQGGIEVQVHDLAMRQLHAGHHVEVVTCARDDGTPRPEPSPVVHRLRQPWTRIPASNRALRAVFEEADVVHAHLSVLSPMSILAVRAAARDGRAVVATLHSLWWWATPLYAIANVLVRWSRWDVHWTAVSDIAASPLRRVLGRHAEVSILPNGVEPADWVVEPLPRDPSEVVVVSVMRLAARKRPSALLHVVRRALDQLPDHLRLRVIVVGEGPQRRRLLREIRRLGLRDVVDLRGRMLRAEIAELYRRADVYLAPAILESFGIAALEARCAGVPVVARRQTGIADFIRNGEHGLLATSDAGLTGALVDLATSPALRSRIAEGNRLGAPETGWAEVVQRCELAYKLAHELTEAG
jgi:glycosyltransferase involved in cell wall biosynthesis